MLEAGFRMTGETVGQVLDRGLDIKRKKSVKQCHGVLLHLF